MRFQITELRSSNKTMAKNKKLIRDNAGMITLGPCNELEVVVSSKRKGTYDYHNWLPTVKHLIKDIDSRKELIFIKSKSDDLGRSEVEFNSVKGNDIWLGYKLLSVSCDRDLFRKSKDRARAIERSAVFKQKIRKENRPEKREIITDIVIRSEGLKMSEMFYRAKLMIDQLKIRGYITDDSVIEGIRFLAEPQSRNGIAKMELFGGER